MVKDYYGVRDNIFDKVFRRSYSDDIEKFLSQEAPQENRAMIDEWEKNIKAFKENITDTKAHMQNL